MKILLYFFCFLGCLVACNKQTISTADVIIPVNESSSSINENEHFKSTRFVALETNDNSLISFISKILFHEDFIAIVDKNTHKICIFDHNGKHIKTISRRGRGPQEYISMSDVSIDVDNNRFVIYDDRGQKFLFYSYDGEWLMNIPYLFTVQNFVIADGYIYLTNYHTTRNDKNFVTRISLENDFAIEHIATFTAPQKSNLFVNGTSISYSNKQILVSSRFDNTVYKVVNNKLLPKYSFDFGDANCANIVNQYDGDELENILTDRQRGYIYGITNVKENDRYTIFTTNIPGFTIYDKQSRKANSYSSIKVDSVLFSSSVSAPTENADNLYISILRPTIISRMKSNEKYEILYKENRADFQKIIDNAKEDDNPILFIHELK